MSDSSQISAHDDAAQDPGQARLSMPLHNVAPDQNMGALRPTTADHEAEFPTRINEPNLQPDVAPRPNMPDRAQPNSGERKEPLSEPDELARQGTPGRVGPRSTAPAHADSEGTIEQKKEEGKPPASEALAKAAPKAVPEAPPEHAELVTVEEAVAIFRTRGLPRHIRTIQKYCARKKGRALNCYQVPTENGIRYMIEKGSIDRFIADATEQVPLGGLEDAVTHDPAPEPQSDIKEERSAAQSGLDVFEHPYVKRLEDQVGKLEVKNDHLQTTVQNVLEQANERLIELQKANAVAQSETLGTFLLEAERIRKQTDGEGPDHSEAPEQVVQKPDVQER